MAHGDKKAATVILSVLILVLIAACGENGNPRTDGKKASDDTDRVSSERTTENSASSEIPLIYIVDSYNIESFPWTREINQGIIAGLEDNGFKEGEGYRLIRATIDAYVNATPEKMEEQGLLILQDIELKQPDVVLTTDDDALQWVGLKVNDIPVVFNGVNGIPEKHLSSPQIDSIKKPGHNITGVYQTAYFQQSLVLLQKLSPGIETFAVITDNTTTGKTLLGIFEQLDPSILPFKWADTKASDSFPEWKQQITQWNDNVDALFLLSANAVRDESGNLMSSDDAVAWIAANSKIPSAACWAYQIPPGILVSATDDGVMQGVYSATMAAKILAGEHPGNLEIVTPPNGVPALNLVTANKLGISVPQDLMNLFIEDGIIVK